MSESTSRLSRREIDVLELLAQGYVEKAMAARLGVTPHTVRGYIRNAHKRMKLDPDPERARRFLMARWWTERRAFYVLP